MNYNVLYCIVLYCIIFLKEGRRKKENGQIVS